MDYQRIIFNFLQIRKYIFLGLGISTLIVGVGLTALLWPESIPPQVPKTQEQTASETTIFIASADFNELDLKARQGYMEKILADTSQHADLWASRKNLNDQQRKQLEQNIRPVFKKMVETRIDHYFTLLKEKREDYLDELIDQALALGEAWKKITKNDPPDPKYKRRQGKNNKGRKRSGLPQMCDQEGFQKFLAKTTPQQRSKMIRFSFAAIKRLSKRNLLPKPKNQN